MPAKLTIKTYGTRGAGFKKVMAKAKTAEGVKGYKLGWPFDAKYDDGKEVAVVAMENEFGVPERFVPERPFFRLANKEFKKIGPKFLESRLKLRDYFLTKEVNEELALKHQNLVQKSIRDLKEPPNAPRTIKEKGSANPLIDTGLMLRSVTYEPLK